MSFQLEGRRLLWFGLILCVASLVGCSGDARGVKAPADGSPPPGSAPASQVPAAGEGRLYISAIELRPEDPLPGGQFVLLVNGTDEPVDLRCWRVRSAATATSATITVDRPLEPAAALRLFPDTTIFVSPDQITLLDRQGLTVDRTRELADQAGDDRIWYRGKQGEWQFGRGLEFPEHVVDGRLLIEGNNGC